MSWTKTLNTKGQYFRKFIQSLKSNTGSVCRNNKNSCHKNSWSLLGTLCFWSHDFTFLSTIIEWEFLIGKKQRAGINIISDIEKLLKWLPVIYTRNKNQWMGWSNRPYSNSKKKLHWKCLLEKGNSGKFCRKSRICSTPISHVALLHLRWHICTTTFLPGSLYHGGIVQDSRTF